MNDASWQRVKELFQEAIGYTGSQRSAFLKSACKGDAELLAEVEALLASHEESEPLMESPTFDNRNLPPDLDSTIRSQVLPEGPGTVIDNYKLLQLIGEGGFAFQSDSTSQHFARTSAKTWTRLQKPDKAIEVWREHVDQMRAANPTGNWNLTNALFEYGKSLLKNDQAKDAEPLLRECLSIREKSPKNNDWRSKEARRVLGECLTKLAKFTEAEAILVEMANALLGDDIASEAHKSEAIQRVVDSYEAWHAAEPGKGYDVKADEWQAKLPTAQPDD